MNMSLNNENMCHDELDNWFNELDEKTIEIINHNLINEESENDNFIGQKIACDSDVDDECVDNATKCICVDDILTKNPNILTSYELIQYECTIAYFVQVLIEGSNNNNNNKIKSIKLYDNDLTFDKMQSIVEYLSWISLASETLAKKIGQELLVHKAESKPTIIRSSYNFCTKYTQCKNFYSKHETPNCREHHYVHSLLKYDVDSVILFLNHIIKNNINMSKEEINNLYLSIKTICFVTRHMAKEISYIDYITKNNSETFHRNNPTDLGKKKTIVKKSFHDNARNIRNELSSGTTHTGISARRPHRMASHEPPAMDSTKYTYHNKTTSSNHFLDLKKNTYNSYSDAVKNSDTVKNSTDKNFTDKNFTDKNFTDKFSTDKFSLKENQKKINNAKPHVICGGFKKIDNIKINKPLDALNNRFSVLSNF
jgi:hypothetical protein